MTLLVVPDKITARHRERLAVVYVRQSSPHQVQHNRESQANQYALVQRALELGWVPERVRVFDTDLATSGQDSLRADFRELVAEVSLAHVGLVLTYEVSRVARQQRRLVYAARPGRGHRRAHRRRRRNLRSTHLQRPNAPGIARHAQRG